MLSRITVMVPFPFPQVPVEMNVQKLMPARGDAMLSSGFLLIFFAFQILSGCVQWQKEHPHKNIQLL